MRKMRDLWVDEMHMSSDKRKLYLDRAVKIHCNKYDYSLVGEIRTNKQYVDIICPEHGKFSQAVSSHVNAKQGCPKCSGNYRRTTEEVLDEIKIVHGDKFIYPPFVYSSNKKKIEILCREHGSFSQGVKEHIKGGGCPRCAKNAKMDTSSFIDKARKKHGDKYDYQNVIYTHNEIHVNITCKKHGDYSQTPHAHLAGYGCSRCVGNSSNKENAWLDSLKIEGLLRQHKIKIRDRRYTVDGFDPETNTIYEFNGDYFHGNFKYFDGYWKNKVTKMSFGELRAKTEEKERLIKSAGYTLISIWESDYMLSLGKPYRDEVHHSERQVNKIAFMRSWQLADEEDFDWKDFADLVCVPPRQI